MRKIDIDILNALVCVHTTDSISDFLLGYGKNASELIVACTFFEENDPDEKIQVVFEKKADDCTIVHEAVHIVNMLFQKKGIYYDLDNDEIQAYMVEYIFNEIKKILENDKKQQ
jgi:hypothetical protein